MIIKPFEKLTKDELWEIRQGIILNSMFYHDYENEYGIKNESLYNFFESYFSYICELADELYENSNIEIDAMMAVLDNHIDTATNENQKQIDELKAKLAEAEAKLNNKDGDGEGKKQPDNIAELIQSAVTAAVQPLQAEIQAFKEEGTAKQALKTAKDALFGNDYAKKYTQERDDAWERAVEIYEATGKKMTADELKNKAMDYFNKSVARKGVDPSKPFEGEGNGDKTPDFSEQKKYLQEQGLIPKDKE